MSEYGTDFVLWSHKQADLLRRMGAGEQVNHLIDWEHVAEEIEALGKSDWRELRRRVQAVLNHLIKLKVSPTIPLRNTWRRIVVEQRDQIRMLLEDSPSLAQRVPEAIRAEVPDARTLALLDIAELGEQPVADPSILGFTEAQVLGPWLPD